MRFTHASFNLTVHVDSILTRPNDLDLKRDAVIFGDLRNIAKLKDIQSLTEDDVRLHAAAVRRLLLEGQLAAAARRRRLPLYFYPADSNPLVRSA